jgi:hypothetical protein
MNQEFLEENQERKREKERKGIRIRRCIMEFTAQGGAFQVFLISALLHTSPKRIKGRCKKMLDLQGQKKRGGSGPAWRSLPLAPGHPCEALRITCLNNNEDFRQKTIARNK